MKTNHFFFEREQKQNQTKKGIKLKFSGISLNNRSNQNIKFGIKSENLYKKILFLRNSCWLLTFC